MFVADFVSICYLCFAFCVCIFILFLFFEIYLFASVFGYRSIERYKTHIRQVHIINLMISLLLGLFLALIPKNVNHPKWMCGTQLRIKVTWEWIKKRNRKTGGKYRAWHFYTTQTNQYTYTISLNKIYFMHRIHPQFTY